MNKEAARGATTMKKTKSSTVASGGNGGRNAEAGSRTSLIYWRENLVAVVEVVAVVVVVVAVGSAYLMSPARQCPSAGATGT